MDNNFINAAAARRTGFPNSCINKSSVENRIHARSYLTLSTGDGVREKIDEVVLIPRKHAVISQGSELFPVSNDAYFHLVMMRPVCTAAP